MKTRCRPRCPACFGAGTLLHPMTDEEVRCDCCDGQGFDPYYTGQQTAADPTKENLPWTNTSVSL